jgi:hypothetical protein
MYLSCGRCRTGSIKYGIFATTSLSEYGKESGNSCLDMILRHTPRALAKPAVQAGVKGQNSVPMVRADTLWLGTPSGERNSGERRDTLTCANQGPWLRVRVPGKSKRVPNTTS